MLLYPVWKVKKTPVPRAKSCETLPMWEELYQMINSYFDGITLQSLLNQRTDIDALSDTMDDYPCEKL